MFSGKSTELMRRVDRAVIAQKRVAVFKPAIDNRYAVKKIVSHSGLSIAAYEISDPASLKQQCSRLEAQVIAIDEVQFFSQGLEEIVLELLNLQDTEEIIAAGLDLDYLGMPFRNTAELMAYADNVVKLSAICLACRSQEGRLTQRIINGEPFTKRLPSNIQIGGKELYEARCRVCWVAPSGNDRNENTQQ